MTAFLYFFFPGVSFSDSTEEPPTIGNYALPASQQPGPLFSFGQNVINNNATQLYLGPDFLKGNKQHYLSFTNEFLYGMSDRAVFSLSVPYAASYYEKPDRAHGLADASAQIEYAFYDKSTSKFSEQATIVASITSPTGTLDNNPATGFGAPGFFAGTTFNRMYTDWYWFFSPGFMWVSPGKDVHIGSEYYYQAGVGRNVISKTNQYLLFALLEFDGLYSQKDTLFGRKDPNSGGNIIFITPSILYSTPKLFIQFGFSIPAYQRWNGEQEKFTYNTTAILGWTF